MCTINISFDTIQLALPGTCSRFAGGTGGFASGGCPRASSPKMQRGWATPWANLCFRGGLAVRTAKYSPFLGLKQLAAAAAFPLQHPRSPGALWREPPSSTPSKRQNQELHPRCSEPQHFPPRNPPLWVVTLTEEASKRGRRKPRYLSRQVRFTKHFSIWNKGH